MCTLTGSGFCELIVNLSGGCCRGRCWIRRSRRSSRRAKAQDKACRATSTRPDGQLHSARTRLHHPPAEEQPGLGRRNRRPASLRSLSGPRESDTVPFVRYTIGSAARQAARYATELVAGLSGSTEFQVQTARLVRSFFLPSLYATTESLRRRARHPHAWIRSRAWMGTGPSNTRSLFRCTQLRSVVC